jgi:uncharacterized OB-fold protein
MSDIPNGRLLPRPTPETAHFWAAARNGELLLQRCTACESTYFPPRPFCPNCSCDEIQNVQASGRGTLLSYVISARPAPGLPAPYVLAIVRLEEGPQMLSNVINCPPTPEALKLDMPLRVCFQTQNDEIALPLFEPETAE